MVMEGVAWTRGGQVLVFELWAAEVDVFKNNYYCIEH